MLHCNLEDFILCLYCFICYTSIFVVGMGEGVLLGCSFLLKVISEHLWDITLMLFLNAKGTVPAVWTLAIVQTVLSLVLKYALCISLIILWNLAFSWLPWFSWYPLLIRLLAHSVSLWIASNALTTQLARWPAAPPSSCLVLYGDDAIFGTHFSAHCWSGAASAPYLLNALASIRLWDRGESNRSIDLLIEELNIL